MKDFFEWDVPELYQKLIVDRFLVDLCKKDVSALREDFDHYRFMISYAVTKRLLDVFYSPDVAPGQELELLEEVFQEYALI